MLGPGGHTEPEPERERELEREPERELELEPDLEAALSAFLDPEYRWLPVGELPFGPLGSFAHRMAVEAQLQHVFDFRTIAIDNGRWLSFGYVIAQKL